MAEVIPAPKKGGIKGQRITKANHKARPATPGLGKPKRKLGSA